MYRWTVNKNLGILNRLSEVNKIGQCNFKIEKKFVILIIYLSKRRTEIKI